MPEHGAETPFEYEVRISRRTRHIRLTVHPDGSVVVTKPILIPLVLVRKFVAKHSDWIQKKLAHAEKNPPRLLSRHSKREYKARKKAARELVYDRIAHLNKLYGHEIGSIRIGNQKSRWGSCSAKKNLNFNYKIIFLPKELQDYVIVHELCHLKELNHSERFWKLVSEQMPDWKRLRKELRKY